VTSSRYLVDPDLLPGLTMGMPASMAHPPTIAGANASGRAVRIAEAMIPGVDGEPDVRVLTFTPTAVQGPLPALLYMHSGGYVSGTPEQAIGICSDFAEHAGCVVVATDYRLAPMTRFPGALLDNYAALKWLHDNAKALNVDRGRIAIGGGSAGGGHAAALAIYNRDRGDVPVILQVLTAPMLDDRTGATQEVGPYTGEFIWTAAANRYGWEALLGLEPGGPAVPLGAVPSRLEDFAGLPPTFIAVGQLELFVDECLVYAQRLIDAGVPTQLVVFPGAYHGFASFVPDAQISRVHDQAHITALRAAFARRDRSQIG
jgi:triacylglycerol lipase